MDDHPSSATSVSHSLDSLGQKELPSLPPHIHFWALVRRRCRRLVRGWWAWELIAAALSVAAMLALLVLLAQADGRQQQTWTVGNTQLTLNTIVVAISTVMRSSLLLVVGGALNQSAWNWFAARTSGAEPEGRPLEDLETFSEAASNSWNSLKLLYRTKGRYIASLGALIMILSTAFDALVQQVLTLETQAEQTILSGENLTVANILPHTLALYVSDENNVSAMDRDYLAVEAALLSGILKTNTSLPGAVCPTGNCTWPVTPTLGICSRCADANVTVISGTRKVTTNDSDAYDITPPFETTSVRVREVTTCNYTAYTLPWPSNFDYDAINSSLTLQTCSNAQTPQLNESNWVLASAPLIGGGWIAGECNAIIANIYSFGVRSTSLPYSLGQMSPFFAYNCSLYFCVRGYSAVTSSGNMKQQPIATVVNESPSVNISAYSDNDFQWQFYDLPTELNAGKTPVFNVSNIWLQNLATPITMMMQGTSSFDTTGPGNYDYGTPNPFAQLAWNASDSLANFSVLIQGLADSLTVYVRTHNASTELDERYAPTVWAPVSVVRVRWYWLAYPLALIVGGQVFLLLTVLATSRRHVRPWKGHRVPLLLAELEESVRTMAVGGLARRTGLDDRVGALHVRLEFDGDDGITFRRVDERVPAKAELLKGGK